ncbi:hypothetical protein HYW17_03035 [Candidatus Uhrbacteria bacterium]|nr:hypothetical protein [Candidatus Uhrbacteria bacterium]
MISLGELIKKVLLIYSAHFRTFLGILIATLLWNIAINTIPVSISTTLRFAIPTFSVSFLIAAFTELALIKSYANFIEEKPVALREIFAQAFRKLPWFILILLIWMTIMLVGITFLIFPAIIFGVWFIFVGTVLMLEDARGFKVFKRSKTLTAGFFFPLLLRAGAITVAAFFVASAASQGFAGILTALLGPANPYGPVFSAIVRAVLTALALPIISGTVVTLYFEMRKLKG